MGLKILHLSSEYPPQQVFGLGRFVHDLSVEAARQGHEVHVVTNSLSGKDFEIVDQGVHVHRVHFPPPPKPVDGTTTVVQFNTQVIERAVPLVREIQPDVVNTHDWLTFLAGRSVNRIFGVPHVLTMHDTMLGKNFGQLDDPGKFAANIERYGCKDANLVICCSQFVRGELTSVYMAPAEKIRIIPCAVNEKSFATSSDDFLLQSFRSVLAQPGEVLVTYVGRFDKEKGLDVLMNAIPDILKVRRDVKFVLAGKGEMDEHLRKWLQEVNLADRVMLPGYLSGSVLSHFYNVSDIHLVPSKYEPFGIVALESMVNGVPTIVANSGGLDEIVDHGSTGLKFTSGSAAELARAVLQLANDADLRARLGEAGRRKALEVYNWTRVSELTAEVYREAATRVSEGIPAAAETPRPVPAQTVEPGPGPSGPVQGKTWILVITKDRLELTQRTLEAIFAHTRPDHELMVIDNGSGPDLVSYLARLSSEGKISLLIRNREGLAPQWQKSYSIAQAFNILSEEALDYLAWLDNDVEVKPGWLETALAVLCSTDGNIPVVSLCNDAEQDKMHQTQQEVSIAGHPVKLKVSTNGALWVMRRSFFARFGLPPIGMGITNMGVEDWHYSRKLQEAGCRFAVLDGLAEHLGWDESAREQAYE